MRAVFKSIQVTLNGLQSLEEVKGLKNSFVSSDDDAT